MPDPQDEIDNLIGMGQGLLRRTTGSPEQQQAAALNAIAHFLGAIALKLNVQDDD